MLFRGLMIDLTFEELCWAKSEDESDSGSEYIRFGICIKVGWLLLPSMMGESYSEPIGLKPFESIICFRLRCGFEWIMLWEVQLKRAWVDVALNSKRKRGLFAADRFLGRRRDEPGW